MVSLQTELSLQSIMARFSHGTPLTNTEENHLNNLDQLIPKVDTVNNKLIFTTTKSYVDTKIQADIADKADQSDLDTLTATVSNKADTSTVNTALSLKADTSTVNTALAAKADTSTVNSALILKADTSYVDDIVADKADTSTVNTALSLKADTSTVNIALAAKADTTTVNSALSAKADTTTVNSALSLKADSTTVTSLQNTVNNMSLDVTELNSKTSSIFSGVANPSISAALILDMTSLVGMYVLAPPSNYPIYFSLDPSENTFYEFTIVTSGSPGSVSYADFYLTPTSGGYLSLPVAQLNSPGSETKCIQKVTIFNKSGSTRVFSSVFYLSY